MVNPKKNTNRYMLIDGNALIHRGFHAIPSLSTKDGQPTNAVYGFTAILLKAIKDIKPTHIACSFDLAGPTFRHEQYKEYKAHRVKGPQELYDQFPKVKEVVRALNIPIFEMPGFEADDVLGTLAHEICEQESKTENEPCEIFIVTGDLDTLQLVNKCVKIYTMKKGLTDTMVYDEKAVRARFGLNPNQMVDYKALRGDPSDNIPGVKGIGEKTAAGLIQEYKSLDGLYEAIKKEEVSGIKPRVLQLLKDNEDMARQSYDLSRIRCDVQFEVVIHAYNFDQEHSQKTAILFRDLEFRSLLSKLPNSSGNGNDVILGTDQDVVLNESSEIGKQEYIFLDTSEKVVSVVRELLDVSEIAIDTETTGLDVVTAKLVGVSLCAHVGVAYYIPAVLALESQELKKLLQSETIKKIGHNIKFDLQILQSAGFVVGGIWFDTMIASFLLNPGSRQHGLDGLSFTELGYQMQPIEDLIGKGKSQITMDQVDPEKVSWYAAEDTDITLRLKHIFEPLIVKEKLEKVLHTIEMPLLEVLAYMELNGIKLDVQLLHALSGSVEIDIRQLETDIYKLTGKEFNINSPKQMKEILFDTMKLVPVENKKNKSGLSTAAGELEKMIDQHPVIQKILEYRELAKLQSTYLLALPELVNKKTGRIHTSYNQTIAATGRLSSTDPNLQNIPVRGEGVGSKVRQAFVAENGFKLLSLDYSQIELRIVAHLAQDKKMIEVFTSGKDIHSKTAMEIFGVTQDMVTPDMRRDAKTINFGILYGVSSFGLSSRIAEMSRGDAQEYIKKYFAAYPQVDEYLEQVKLQVREEGFVRNEIGRIRKFPEIRSSQFFIRAAAERAAINFPIQSLAADVIKVAMINIFKEIAGKTEEIKMLLQVHDELVFEVKEDKVVEWAKKIKPLMEGAIQLSVPIEVEAKVGDNWGEMEKIRIE